MTPPAARDNDGGTGVGHCAEPTARHTAGESTKTSVNDDRDDFGTSPMSACPSAAWPLSGDRHTAVPLNGPEDSTGPADDPRPPGPLQAATPPSMQPPVEPPWDRETGADSHRHGREGTARTLAELRPPGNGGQRTSDFSPAAGSSTAATAFPPSQPRLLHGHHDQWLFPGRQPEAPMNPVCLPVRQREIGVPAQRGRISAIRRWMERVLADDPLSPPLADRRPATNLRRRQRRSLHTVKLRLLMPEPVPGVRPRRAPAHGPTS